jgi:hypothetical protein
MAKHEGAVAIAVDASPKRMLRIVPTLDGEPCGDPQMVRWPGGWSTADIVEELMRQAAGREDGTAWGVPGAKRFVLRVASETPERIEINALGFSDARLAEAWVKRDASRREKELRELEEQVEARQRVDKNFKGSLNDLERRMDQKMAELRGLAEEAQDFDRDFLREAREFKLRQEARRDEKAADLLGRQRRIERELEELRSQVRDLPSAV